MRVYVLFENDYDGGNSLKAVITRKDVADYFAEGRGDWYEEIELDDYTEVAWIVTKLAEQSVRIDTSDGR